MNFNSEESASDCSYSTFLNYIPPFMPKFFNCEGCIVNHPSQLRHQCIKDSKYDKVCQCGKDSLFYVNDKDLCEKIYKNRFCFYTPTFFKILTS